MEVLPHPLASRSKVQGMKKQKWHNALRQQIARMDAESKQPAQRQSRVSAWVSHTEQTRKKFGPTLPSSLEIDRAHIILGKVDGNWKVCYVITIWRAYQSKPGNSQLSVKALPRGSLSAARVLCAWVALKLIFWGE